MNHLCTHCVLNSSDVSPLFAAFDKRKKENFTPGSFLNDTRVKHYEMGYIFQGIMFGKFINVT